MDIEMSPAEITKNLRYLMDRSEILDCISKHARGHDRHDIELLTSTYHKDGIDEHGYAINEASDYAQWANDIHAVSSSLHMHNITTHTCEIEGDVAYCESYVMVALLDRDLESARLISGRYVDQLERREGQWKISLRRTLVDLSLAGDASILKAPMFTQQGFAKGQRNKTDISYQRPLGLEDTPERW